MPENSLRVVVRMVAGPGRGAYELLRNRGDPIDFTFVEDWEDDLEMRKIVSRPKGHQRRAQNFDDEGPTDCASAACRP